MAKIIKNRKIIIGFIILFVFLLYLLFPLKIRQNALTDEDIVALYNKHFTDEVINVLPVSLANFIASNKNILYLISFDQKKSGNLSFGTLILKSKDEYENIDQYYLFNFFKNKRYFPFKDELLFEWNEDNYYRKSNSLYIEGYNFINIYDKEKLVMENYANKKYIIPLNYRQYEGFAFHKILYFSGKDKNFDYTGTYKRKFSADITSTPKRIGLQMKH